MKHFKSFVILNLIAHVSFVSSQRSLGGSIAEQLAFGVKRTTYYFETLMERCDNVGDFEDWITSLNDYLYCNEEAHPTKQLNALGEEDSLARLDELCRAWTSKRECSSRLATKLDSCLGSSLEDGDAGKNGRRLALTHMNFICHHKREYISVLQQPAVNSYGEFLAVEKRPLMCYNDIKSHMNDCIRKEEFSTRQETFCQKFHLSHKCILKTAAEFCSNEKVKGFFKTMLGELAFELGCESENELKNLEIN